MLEQSTREEGEEPEQEKIPEAEIEPRKFNKIELEEGKSTYEKQRGIQFKERKKTRELIAQCIISISRVAH